jgi:hypothetical protein
MPCYPERLLEVRRLRTLYVGDVHGCARELGLLLACAGAERVVMLGDLFTKGPDPLGVWSMLQQVGAESLLGNHDDYLLRTWERADPPAAVAALRRGAPEARAWLAGLPLILRSPGVIAVHAGVHPLLGPDHTTREQALVMRRWPDDRDPDNPFWYDAGWAGPETVVFGHDAARGLVRRERGGRPIAVGLDTGCVYGGSLSGWIAEEDRLLQVPAARTYHPIG